MSPEGWLTLVVLSAVLVLLVAEKVAPAVAVFGGNIVLLVAGVITPSQALEGFSNPAPFAVAALFIVARAVEKTGAIQPLLRRTLAGIRSPRSALARLLLPVMGSSAFLNNTPIVAMVAPQVAAWARQNRLSPSLFLMPLSFAAILGGVVTAIGTSTNVVASGLMASHGMDSMGMFEITRLGLPVAVGGILYLVLASPRLLPHRVRAFTELEAGARDFVVEMEVVSGGALDGVTVESGGLRGLQGVFLAEVWRDQLAMAPVAPDVVLRGGDLLVFVGQADQVLDLRNNAGLRSAQDRHARVFHAAGHGYYEAVVGASSPLVGTTLKQMRFRSRYQAAVLGIHRAGAPVRAKLGSVSLQVGDTLLLLSDAGFRDRWRDRADFLTIAALDGLAPTSTRQAWLVGAVLAGVVIGNAIGFMEILQATLLAALVLVGTRVLTATEARRAVDLNVILVIAASFGLGRAMEETGLAHAAASGLVGTFGTFGPMGAYLGIVLATLLLTELITNNAAVVLMFPIAMATAAADALDPRTVALSVAVAASASFLTPIGYQTNTMVYGPGGYRFGDYARLGIPLTLLVIAILMFLGGP